MIFSNVIKKISLRIVTHFPLSESMRLKFTRWGGVKTYGNRIFIGEGVIFDSLYPEEIEIEDMVHVTMRCILLTHNLTNPAINRRKWTKGHIRIGFGSFIGANTVICNSVNIGKNCIVGAGSVVTKDIPDNEIWAGNPARFIKKRTGWGDSW